MTQGEWFVVWLISGFAYKMTFGEFMAKVRDAEARTQSS